MRNASISDGCLHLVGDFNATTDIEVVGGAPQGLATLEINGKSTEFKQDKDGVVKATVDFEVPELNLPALSDLDWKYIDSLPEASDDYDDSAWPTAGLPITYNSDVNLSTPTSLLGADYGFVTGVLLFRGHFTANGNESSLYLQTQGGSAFGSSAWLNGTFLGSFKGFDAADIGNSSVKLPSLKAGAEYVVTVVVDEMGMDENCKSHACS